MTTVIVCRPRRYPIRRVLACPTCKTRRRMITHYEVWYGTSLTCCHCGDHWQDGELYRRPSRRGWRKEAAAKAAAEWLAAGRHDPVAFETWVKRELGEDQ
ncbi:hypothetical protein ACIGBL_33450 [Streptomyces sp. NPDC085614]|uniref:hypothetical protein n=1 Tax=Streptomyces sp. NPDC085614 TaxID=3365733 RepID=UPI0037D4FC29